MTAILTIDSLSMHFGGLIALNNINLGIEKNSITALIGPNGAGKTTLFNCLTGFYQPSHGEINYQNQDKILNLRLLLGPQFSNTYWFSPKRLAQYIYYNMFGGSHLVTKAGICRTFQHARLFREMTVIENLLIGQHLFANRNLISGLLRTKSYRNSEKNLIEQAYHWLDYFHLTADANRLAGELPYGKQRLLEIARSLCAQPKILCLDEPAAGLNPHESKDLGSLIVSLKQNHHLTIILIEHNMSLVMNISDYVYVLVKGELISQGAPEVVKKDEKVIEAYLGQEKKGNTE